MATYDEEIPPKLRKVVDHYVARGKLEIHKFQPFYVKGSLQQYMTNHLSKMDCFYRNMNKYQFMVLIDVDEAGSKIFSFSLNKKSSSTHQCFVTKDQHVETEDIIVKLFLAEAYG